MNRPSREQFTTQINELLEIQDQHKGKVSRKDFEVFCKEYIFDVLIRNDTFGSAFCRRYNIDDLLLCIFLGHDVEKSIKHIETAGYLYDPHSD